MLGYHPRIESDTIEQLERMTRRSNEVEPTHTDDKAVDLNDVRRKARDDMIELGTALKAEKSLSRKAAARSRWRGSRRDTPCGAR